MAWNDLDVGGDHAEDVLYVGDKAVDTAATAHVDIGKCAVEEVVASINDRLPRFETIKKFKILRTDFSQESGELTPTMKIKRPVITERYANMLDGFYDETS